MDILDLTCTTAGAAHTHTVQELQERYWTLEDYTGHTLDPRCGCGTDGESACYWDTSDTLEKLIVALESNTVVD